MSGHGSSRTRRGAQVLRSARAYAVSPVAPGAWGAGIVSPEKIADCLHCGHPVDEHRRHDAGFVICLRGDCGCNGREGPLDLRPTGGLKEALRDYDDSVRAQEREARRRTDEQ
jgi:hypothetical protein